MDAGGSPSRPPPQRKRVHPDRPCRSQVVADNFTPFPLAFRAPLRWRYLISAPLDGAANMALDEALLARAAETGESVLRIYGWSAATLSLGRHQVARGAYDLERARRLGVRFVRRPTGGRALMHDREVTYSVTARTDSLGDLRESYARINRLLIDGLCALGAQVSVAAPAGVAPTPSVLPCFERPVKGEIAAHGRKLVGSAQWRDGGALLQHGSILLEDDQALAADLLLDRCDPPPPPATLSMLLGRRPAVSEVTGALLDALHRLEDDGAGPLAIDGCLAERASIALARYQDEEWTWRR